MLLIHHYRHLRVIYLVDLPAINGNSLMAVACIYLHRRHVVGIHDLLLELLVFCGPVLLACHVGTTHMLFVMGFQA